MIWAEVRTRFLEIKIPVPKTIFFDFLVYPCKNPMRQNGKSLIYSALIRRNERSLFLGSAVESVNPSLGIA